MFKYKSVILLFFSYFFGDRYVCSNCPNIHKWMSHHGSIHWSTIEQWYTSLFSATVGLRVMYTASLAQLKNNFAQMSIQQTKNHAFYVSRLQAYHTKLSNWSAQYTDYRTLPHFVISFSTQHFEYLNVVYRLLWTYRTGFHLGTSIYSNFFFFFIYAWQYWSKHITSHTLYT